MSMAVEAAVSVEGEAPPEPPLQEAAPEDASPPEADQAEPSALLSMPADMQWYAANTRLGQVHIGLEVQPLPSAKHDTSKVVGKAALLASAEMLIQGLESWQAIELDLEPAKVPADTVLALRIHSHADESIPPAFVAFEAKAFKQLNDVTLQFAGEFGVDSFNIPLKLTLDSMSVSIEEYNLISAGAMVLLPSSFEASWPVQALFSHGDARQSMPLGIDRSNQTLTLLDQTASVQAMHTGSNCNANNVQLSVMLDDPISLPLALMLSPRAQAFEQPLSLINAAVTITENGRALAVGNICQVGSGCGIVVGGLGSGLSTSEIG
ncbi:MAG: hypothetical protein V3U65_13515 [Granulosicoccaceae bacterium]